MDLILWRHAEAQDLEAQDHGAGLDDMARPLTRRGEKQAARMAAWLDRQLPEGTRILVSPARRTLQTANALGRKYRVHDALQPGAQVDAVLHLAGWPDARVPVLIVGHQPTLGQVAARLLGMTATDCAMRKGAVWWLRQRQRQGLAQTVVQTVQTPDLL
ncbi:SixA phosphatase family protein [Ottowia sp.]|uniref:SixA phosphatase family protein n=1 Tax=Ottowia sp. TaxID=1898956 RepID=UPI003A89ACD8